MGDISLIGYGIVQRALALTDELVDLPELERIEVINRIKVLLHEVSPMRNEPVDCVLWVSGDDVQANDYNPNNVAPPEMELLYLSIKKDGVTMPVVTGIVDGKRETVDGFHRGMICKKPDIHKRLLGLVPVSTVMSNVERDLTRSERMAATIRHNRARGRHQVENMSEIVVELSRRNWSDKKIGRELGMDPDEVLRLKQISGLSELFADREFSEAWEVDWLAASE